MITSFYAGILALLFMKISMDTIKARRANRVSLGYGANNEIVEIVSAHANFAAYTALLLLLTFLAEQAQIISAYLIHLLAAAFTLGRFLHYFAFVAEKMNFKLRTIGMQLTLWPLVILACINIYIYIATFV